MIVPFLDLQTQHRNLKEDLVRLYLEIMDSSSFIGGKHVQQFEDEFAQACSVKHCVSVNSGTDALRFIFLALGLQPGDEVITVPNTFIATTEAITQAGGTIRFIDVLPNTLNMDPEKIELAITPRTKGIVPVHLYGQMADMDPIMKIAEKYGLWVVEDACQAHLAEYKGMKAGSLGIAAAFSFYPGKNLGACGEAGAVTTNQEQLALKVRMLRDHGQTQKYIHEIEGYNGRCDTLQAAILRLKLRYLSQWNKARREIANLYMERLQGISGIILPFTAKECLPVYHLFVVQLKNRDHVREALGNSGIQTGLHYPIPLHLQEAYKHLPYPEGVFPVTEAASKNILSLPIYPDMTKEQVEYVCEQLKLAVT